MTFPEQGYTSRPERTSQKAPQKAKRGGSGFFAGIMQWLRLIHYNGLYVIVLKPSMPEGMLYGMAIIGLLLWCSLGMVCCPVVWTGE